jgi:hypothetical protein
MNVAINIDIATTTDLWHVIAAGIAAGCPAPRSVHVGVGSSSSLGIDTFTDLDVAAWARYFDISTMVVCTDRADGFGWLRKTFAESRVFGANTGADLTVTVTHKERVWEVVEEYAYREMPTPKAVTR